MLVKKRRYRHLFMPFNKQRKENNIKNEKDF